ncbi:MAG TPA: amylo-alpha-1,6-glucosidase [Candidatus Paceibacterota bacterium]
MVEESGEKKLKVKGENMADLVKSSRFPKTANRAPVPISADQKELIERTGADLAQRLENNYQSGFGVFPSAGSRENFYEQVWTRDFAHAAGNYFAAENLRALKDSLETIFRNQRNDGCFPYKVEKRYALLQIIPKIGPGLAKKLFDLVEVKLKHRAERPLYEGEEFSGAEDTIPVVIIAVGEFFLSSEEGRKFAKNHFGQVKRAIDYFREKTDMGDGLVKVTRDNPDWADSLYRKGKLGTINVLWARSLRFMAFISKQLGYENETQSYRDEYRKVKSGVMRKLYNKKEGYFRAKEGDDRIDAVASIFGALYLLNPEEAVRVEENLKQRLRHRSGLKNFDPPYPKKEIFWVHKLLGHEGYHNEFVWPWVACQNIQVKIKIALKHPDEAVRSQYKAEAVNDLVDTAKLFKDAGGAYEIFHPDDRKPAFTRWYNPPQNLMSNLATYEGAYLQLKELNWI